ncbi:hypothetical protein GCM10010220_60430 [Streptomyces parvulus]|nr:hypothetical protein GCM10010220_60430 [Streptomyces parvulus]
MLPAGTEPAGRGKVACEGGARPGCCGHVPGARWGGVPQAGTELVGAEGRAPRRPVRPARWGPVLGGVLPVGTKAAGLGGA